MEAHLFNPENDTALGANLDSYTPPKAATALHRDGAMLPLWWAKPGDCIITPSTEGIAWMTERFGEMGGRVVESIAEKGVDRCVPWGWSRDARSQFIKAGADVSILPDDSTLDRLRNLSHRRMSITVNEWLKDAMGSVFKQPLPIEIADTNDLPKGECYVKQPWSSSGRGVMKVDGRALTSKELKSIKGMISNQGSVLVETALDGVADFAMLFYCDSDACRFKSLSLFSTDPMGHYTGNVVAPSGSLFDMLSRYGVVDVVERLAADLEGILHALYGADYEGWIGVDMMVYKDSDGKLAVAPCIEINMRMTMGVVAYHLSHNPLINKMMPATFSVKPASLLSVDDFLILPPGQFSFSLSPIKI